MRQMLSDFFDDFKSDYYHSLTNYISHNSLPRLITDCIHLYLITLFSSPLISLVFPFTHCEVLYVVTLHSRAFRSGFLSPGFWISCLFLELFFCL